MPRKVRTDRQACQTCRRQKRRCDKALPACSLCCRAGRDCRYDASTPSRPPSPEIAHGAAQAAVPGPSPSNNGTQFGSNGFTIPRQPSGFTALRTKCSASFFLDYKVFKLLRPAVTDESDTALLPDLMRYIRHPAQIRQEVDIYFQSTHMYFPVVSKLRLYQELSTTTSPTRADTILFLSASQLHTQLDVDNEPAHRALYWRVKAGCVDVERSGVLSVRALQAILLVALYEITNAIYPAAYLTVGHCARLGHMMSLHFVDKTPQLIGPPSTVTELEERRRVWWSIIILDRYVNLGCNRPMGCDDASPNDFLPIDDRFWDQGDLASVQPLVSASSVHEPASAFARACQASHLLSRVLRQIRDRDTDADILYQEAIQLHRTLLVLSSLIRDESHAAIERSCDVTAQLPLFTAAGVCFSALLTLYGRYSCADDSPEEHRGNANLLEMQKQAIAGLKEVLKHVVQLAQRVEAIAQLGGMLKMSPFISNCLYQAGAACLWWIRESGSQEGKSMLVVIRGALRLLGTRWESPRRYIDILEQFDTLMKAT
ncbi:fungal-specific transcription factor domain-containing protein [Emericellopsis atlantica]|uniref:Fungal-specific transcription factor domain-containing protein n=1 Tax=Emericellopsis atlantica TaxID=2614577 RepID=A0A9P7ZJ18_9HYPO|nr:fungal-specific transcription factor domain-containing protein [Emericellopsis atlantica]KAG9252682.1 fungal-specific transcription factor domain-containing protein [Emericellopsis atlantica]